MAKKRKYHQGRFTPKNPEKYIGGDVNKIVYRSRWEKNYMMYLDSNPAILCWNSEDLVIPYNSPLDNKTHRYHIDMYIKYRHTDDSIRQAIIEIKPHAQTLVPVKGRKHQKTYIAEVKTYIVNKAKWEAAERFAEKQGITFVILTEKMMPQLLRG